MELSEKIERLHKIISAKKELNTIMEDEIKKVKDSFILQIQEINLDWLELTKDIKNSEPIEIILKDDVYKNVLCPICGYDNFYEYPGTNMVQLKASCDNCKQRFILKIEFKNGSVYTVESKK